MSITVRPLSYALGAEIQGVDLAKPLSNSEFDQIHRTFLESGILLFRDQKITREQHIAFSRRFGELDNHDSLPRDRHPDYPELLLVTNIPKENGKPSDSQVHRPAMALRHVVHAGAVARLAAARHHHPAGRRRHDVHQHVPWPTTRCRTA